MNRKYTIRFPVRFRDVDVLGHVNNAVYFTYMETARTEFWINVFGTPSLHELSFIVAHAECDFKAPAHFGDELEVSVWTSSIKNSSFVWDYEIKNLKTDQVVATGKTIQVYYNHKTKQSSPVPAEVKEKLISW